MRSNLVELGERIAAEYHVDIDEMLGRRRTKRVAQARHAFMRAVRELGLSYPEIGALCDRDHTTVLVACRGGKGRAA